MKVTFVHLDRLSFFKSWRGIFHFGIGSLSAVLKRNGHQTSLIHITGEMDRETFVNLVKDHSPDLLAFTSTTPIFPWVAELISWAKNANPGIPVICGGMHVTLQPEEVINTDGVDIICLGEGEYPLLELCNLMEKGKDFTSIPNLWVKNKNKIYKNQIRPLVEDLDKLPFVDRDLFDFPNLYFEKLEKEGGLLVSRGCPYNCSYCCNHALRKTYKDKGKYVRFRSVDSVITEIKELLGDYPFVKKLLFYDDILFQNKKWMREFVPKYKQEVNLPYSCNVRPNLVTEEIVSALKESGCYCIRIGLESGNNEIRNAVLNRNLSDEQMRKAFTLFRQANIDIWTFNMLGIPGEDVSKILDTIKLNVEAGTSKYSVGICRPFPGTKIYDLAKEKGMLTSKQLSDFYQGSILKHETLSEEQLLMFENHFDRLVLLYRSIRRIPAPLSNWLEGLIDKILSNKHTPYLLKQLLKPAYFLHRQLENFFRRKDYEKA